MKALLIVSSILLIHITAPMLYFKFGLFKAFYHDFMGWHMPSETEEFDGVSFTSVCKHCGKKIIQDSQGGWF